MISFKKYLTYDFLTEGLMDADMDKAMRLILSSIQRRLPSSMSPINRLPGIERFVNSKGKGFGIRFFTKDKKSFRFNFSKSSIGSNKIDSIDVFTPKGGKTPVININTKEISLVRIIPFIAKMIAKPKPGKYDVDIFQEAKYNAIDEPINEAIEIEIDGVKYNTKGDARRALRAKGFKGSKMEQMLKQSVIVTKGSPEKSNMDVSKTEAAIKKIKIDPNDILDKHIPAFTSGIAKGIKHTLIIAGTPGVGKSFGVDKQLKSMYGPENGGKNPNWVIFKGKVSEASVFEQLFRHNGKVIVFDDADSVFASTDAINLLKAALDTKAQRFVTSASKSHELFDANNIPYVYGTQVFKSKTKAIIIGKKLYKAENQIKGQLSSSEEQDVIDAIDISPMERYHKLVVDLGKIPSTFEFTGSIIFISNKKMADIDTAIRDRSIAPIELDMSLEQIIDRIDKIKEFLTPGDDGDNVKDLTASEKQMVLDHFRISMKEFGKTNVSLRAFKTAMLYYQMDPQNWKELVNLYVGI